MLSRSGLRIAVSLVFAFSAVGFAAAPASAEVVVRDCWRSPSNSNPGKCGYWEIYDNSSGMPGAKCTYGNAFPYKLLNISVRRPLMHGYYPSNQKVGWRVVIQRHSTSGGNWTPIFTSSWQTDMANDAIPANSFSRRTWYAPSNPSGYWYRVIEELAWWNNGVIEGYTRVRLEWYRQERANGSVGNLAYGYCTPSN